MTLLLNETLMFVRTLSKRSLKVSCRMHSVDIKANETRLSDDLKHGNKNAHQFLIINQKRVNHEYTYDSSIYTIYNAFHIQIVVRSVFNVTIANQMTRLASFDRNSSLKI